MYRKIFFLSSLCCILSSCYPVSTLEINPESVLLKYDKTIVHPACLYELTGWCSDWSPSITSVDINAIPKGNKYGKSKVTIEDTGWIRMEDGDILGENASFSYKCLGIIGDIYVIETLDCSGGTGVFMDLMMVKLEKETVLDHDVYIKRIILKQVGRYGLGDRDDGKITISGNKIIIGRSKNRAEPHIIEVP